MTAQEVKRKLVAILSADVKGYSRLMGVDEKGTVRTLNTYKEIMTDLIRSHYGRVVEAPGDNILAEFASVVDAVECAVQTQKELKIRNAELPENRRMEFRIGVNLGDVIEDGQQILGDGVNIAARVQSLADGGGICISGTAFDQVRNKLELGYEYLGEQSVKNITLPVRVYRVLMEPEAAGKVIGEKKVKPRQWQRIAIGLVVVLVVVVAAVLVWRLYFRPTPSVEVASREKMAFPLPDKPSIAVLPFVNMSEDPKQEFFCDGMTEEIINALSKVPNVFVIARNSTFTYKGKAVKVQQVSEEMGVRYVLEGSVRKEGDRVRVTAQLIDATTGYHLFSERYDRVLKEIFAIQDEITMKILTAIRVKLTEGISARMLSKGASNIEAYLLVLESRELLLRFNKDDNALARKKCEEAIALDPGYPGAYGLLSTLYVMDMVFGVSPKESMEKAIAAAQKAVTLDDTRADAHLSLGFVYAWRRQYDEAVAEGERAVELEPGSAGARFNLGRTLDYACRHQEAIEMLKKAVRMNPFPPTYYFFHLGYAYFNSEQFDRAIAAYQKALQLSPTNMAAHQGLAACYGHLGRMEEARLHAQELLKFNPKFTVEGYLEKSPFKERATRERWAEGFRKAGLK